MWACRRSLITCQHSRSLSSVAGCFAGIPGLYEAKNWTDLANNAAARCQALVNEVVTTPPSAKTVQLLDDISDALCQVLDAAEFCRNVHADPEWRVAAEQVCIGLGSYVHDLNTNCAMYTALSAALPPKGETKQGTPHFGNEKISAGDVRSSNGPQPQLLDEETELVGRMLQRDFERYGVHLSGDDRDKMAALVGRSQALGFAFTQNLGDPAKCGELRAARSTVEHFPPAIRALFRPASPSGDAVIAAGDGGTLAWVMHHADDEKLRSDAYRLYCGTPTDNLKVLDALVEARHEMAALMGFRSFAAYQLDGFSLAGVPAAVHEFLGELHTAVSPAARAEAATLAAVKQRESRDPQGQLRAWDRDWAMGITSAGGPIDDLSSLGRYITLDGCVSGLSELLGRLMGIKLREEAPARGEAWAPGVKKLIAEDPEGGKLGVVYLDLYRRKGKFPGAAHFTLRCGRAGNGGGAGATEAYQTPIVALVANFSGAHGAAGLTHTQLETLLHEFGHALNSLLSRTKYQHLSGTRGPQDIIELPSHVFERFAIDPEALKLLSQHSGAATPPPETLLAAAAASKRHFAALSLESTLALCAVDQLLHGENPPVGSAAEREVGATMAAFSSLGHEPGTHPHARFNHLIGYGANYYCYLYAQSLSAAVWEQPGEGSWPAGEVLRRQLLEPGGAKAPLHFISDIFGGRPDGVLVAGQGGGWYPKVDGLMAHLGLKS